MINRYWIGARESDIKNEKVFKGSITRYGTNLNQNKTFPKSRQKNEENAYTNFIINELNNILNEDINSSFIFSNANTAYKMPDNILKHCECLNPFSLIVALNDKFFVRQYLSNVCHVPPNIIINGKLLKDLNLINKIFNQKFNRYVVQRPIGGGGRTTFFIDKANDSLINDNDDYLVTPYYEKCIPLNVHCVIYQDDVLILPPSIQLIVNSFKYLGADYFAINTLPFDIKNELYYYSLNICKKFQKLGVRGVLGLDFILVEDELFFLESNLRFQGSSFLLNLGLNNFNISLYELYIKSFCNNKSDVHKEIFYEKINLSFYKVINNMNIEIPLRSISDNYDGYSNDLEISNNAYKYNKIFSESIFSFFSGNQ